MGIAAALLTAPTSMNVTSPSALPVVGVRSDDQLMDIDHIRARCASDISVDVGWRPLLIDLDAALTEADPELRYIQISQKYGRLIVYTTSSTNEEVRLLIHRAEELASRTCEMCGDTTATMCQRRSWLRTLCPSCAAENKYVAK